MDTEELEREQLNYMKKKGITVASTDPFPDPVSKNLDIPVVLTKEQEEEILEKLRTRIEEKAVLEKTAPEKVQKEAKKVSLDSYLKLLSNSFIGIMDDLLNFDGNLEDLPIIFTKNNRLVFVATVLIIISVLMLRNKTLA